MTSDFTALPPRFLRTPEAARFLGLSGRTLEKHRTYGTGPAYRKLGGRVVYAIEDLQSWAARAPSPRPPTPTARSPPPSPISIRRRPRPAGGTVEAAAS